MKIEINASNLDKVAKKVATAVNTLGFQKNDKPMTNSQALRVLATILGFRQGHAMVDHLKQEHVMKDEPKAPTILPVEIIPQLVELGYSVSESDFHRPYWIKDDEGSEDYDHDMAAWQGAYEDALAHGHVFLDNRGYRRKLADEALAVYSFGENTAVAAVNGWEDLEGGRILVCAVFLEDLLHPEWDTRKVYFYVEFDSAKGVSVTGVSTTCSAP